MVSHASGSEKLTRICMQNVINYTMWFKSYEHFNQLLTDGRTKFFLHIYVSKNPGRTEGWTGSQSDKGADQRVAQSIPDQLGH